MNSELIIKLLKYTVVVISAYLVSKYNPVKEFSTLNSILASLVCLIIFMGMEFIYEKCLKPKKTNCDDSSCKVEQFAEKDKEEETEEVDDSHNKQLMSALDKLNNRLDEMDNKIDVITRKNDDDDSRDEKKKEKQNKDNDSMDMRKDTVHVNYHNLPNTPHVEQKYGYSFLPPSQWYPQPPQPPVCVTDKKCPVCPSISDSGFTSVMEWENSTNVTKPMGINTKYIDEELNLKK